MLKRYKLGLYSPLALPLKIILEALIITFVWLHNYPIVILCFVSYAVFPLLLINNNTFFNNTLLYHVARGYYIWNHEVPRPLIIQLIRYSIMLAIVFMMLHLLFKNIVYTFYIIAIFYCLRAFTIVMFYKISKATKGYNNWVIFLSNNKL